MPIDLLRIEADGAYANLVLGPMLATSGLTDMDAISLSMAGSQSTGQVPMLLATKADIREELDRLESDHGGEGQLPLLEGESEPAAKGRKR